MSASAEESVIPSSLQGQCMPGDTSQATKSDCAGLATECSTSGHSGESQWPVFAELQLWLQRELRSDHAGEYGAVMIYRGILAVSRDEQARQFAERHLITERQHLRLMEEIVPVACRTRLLPLWHVMGWLTGALPALFGRKAIFSTIEAVETFVDHHYGQQVTRLNTQGNEALLRQTLLECQADEVNHRDEAACLAMPTKGFFLRIWCWFVGAGSAAAVIAARRT